VIDVALIPLEAPATVLQVASLAESGYYNGLTIHRVVPNFVLQGGSPDANEYVGHPDYMRDELGQWPHVRGAVGISTRGRDTGDAQFFIDLLDNPRLDHQYTVFGQVIAGLDVADRILEGDVIESVQILDERKAPR
jgi:peptidyl-prolyl cis-trans isomerase B (cyclophilin B)